MIIKKKRKRDVPGLNTTSTADISFILLVFFLVISSMDSNKGILRQLPPADAKQTEQTTELDRRNVFEINIGTDGRLTASGKTITPKELRQKVAAFVENCPRRATHVVNITMQATSRYEDYYRVIDAVGGAYTDLRRAAAQKLYHKQYSRCSQYERDKIDKLYPQRVMEDIENAEN